MNRKGKTLMVPILAILFTVALACAAYAMGMGSGHTTGGGMGSGRMEGCPMASQMNSDGQSGSQMSHGGQMGSHMGHGGQAGAHMNPGHNGPMGPETAPPAPPAQ